MRFPTFIVLLHAKTRWLTPPELEGKVEFGMQSRIDADFAFVSVVSDPTKAKELLAAHVLDIAATDAEVWTKFPVLRGDFVVKVNRRALFEERTLEVRLRETVVGDQLCVNKAAFISAIENGFQLPGTQSQIEYDFELPIADIAAECPHFAGSEEPSALSVEGKAIFFLDAFSVSGLEDSQLTKQMRFMSPRAFARDTNFIALVQEADQKGFSRLADRLPTNFSSVLVVDEGEEGERNFAWAMVGRVLACVAALSNCQGRIAVEARISSTGWSTRNYQFENWRLPYGEPTSKRPHTFDASTPEFTLFRSLCNSTDREAFVSAKEDARLLSLETAADARASGILPLQFVQVWMAIERLLSFKAETTVQLAVALSALVPQTDRSAEFARAKKAYNLRSRIAHGYDFRRDDAMFYELEWLASVFRTLMKVALRVEGVGDLKDRLIDHVLSGAHDRIS